MRPAVHRLLVPYAWVSIVATFGFCFVSVGCEVTVD